MSLVNFVTTLNTVKSCFSNFSCAHICKERLLHGGLVCFKLEVEQPVYQVLVFQNSLAVLEVAIHVEVRFLGALSAK